MTDILRSGIEEIIADYAGHDDYGFAARLRRLLDRADMAPAAAWRADDPPRGVSLWVTVNGLTGREVTIAKVSKGIESVTWYSNGLFLMRKVLAWMPMERPEPAP
jgi:hypothetical protein